MREARNDLADWMRQLFDKELAQRDMQLSRAHNDPGRHRQIMDAGFELLDEVTDPDLRSRPTPRPPVSASGRGAAPGMTGWLGSVLGTWRWFALVLASLVFLSVAAGIYIGSGGERADHGYLHVISDRPGVFIKIGNTDVGTAPVNKIAVMPGLHRVRGVHEGRTSTQEVRIHAGENRVVKLRFDSSGVGAD